MGFFLEGKVTPGDKEAQVFPCIEGIEDKFGHHCATMPMNVRGDGQQPNKPQD